MCEKRDSYLGCYQGGNYEYYDIKDFDTCIGCKHFHDNSKDMRFECDTPICHLERKYHL